MTYVSITSDVHYLYLLTSDNRVFRLEKRYPDKGLQEVVLNP